MWLGSRQRDVRGAGCHACSHAVQPGFFSGWGQGTTMTRGVSAPDAFAKALVLQAHACLHAAACGLCHMPLASRLMPC